MGEEEKDPGAKQCLQASEREAKKEECPTIELMETLISMGRYAMPLTGDEYIQYIYASIISNNSKTILITFINQPKMPKYTEESPGFRSY